MNQPPQELQLGRPHGCCAVVLDLATGTAAASAHVGMPGVVEDRLVGAPLHHPTEVHHGDLVAHVPHHSDRSWLMKTNASPSCRPKLARVTPGTAPAGVDKGTTSGSARSQMPRQPTSLRP